MMPVYALCYRQGPREVTQLFDTEEERTEWIEKNCQVIDDYLELDPKRGSSSNAD